MTTGTGAPPENQPAPRSDEIPGVTPADQGTPQTSSDLKAPADPNELKPGTVSSDPANPAVAAAPDPNELKPNVAQETQPAPAPAQVNELQVQPSGTTAAPSDPNAVSSSKDLADDNEVASSKHKKKKGLRKIIPMR